MDMCEDRKKQEDSVLCGANAYERKYYFNKEYDKLPSSIKDELHIMCVFFTESVGGILTVVFEEDGILAFRTEYAPDDFAYDEIASGLLIGEMRREREELLEAVSLYYRVFVLGTVEDLKNLNLV